MERVVIDTNVFVAAGFNPRSAAARILDRVRDGRLQLVWNRPTRDETEMILRRIPRLDCGQFAELFQPEAEYFGSVDPDAFAAVPDRDDRKFAALSAAANAPLVTSDYDLLAHRDTIGIAVLTPREFLGEY
jgi:predicted nucleic acid-binding protein